MVRSPSRASSWSSAMITLPRRGGSRISDCMLGFGLRHVRQRHLGDHLRPFTWLAGDGAMAAQERDTFVHAQQADAFPWARAILLAERTKAAAPVTHLQA